MLGPVAPAAANAWPCIENARAIHVPGQNDVKGRTGVGDHEGADAESAGQGPATAREDTVPYVERCPAIVHGNIVRVHHAAAAAGSAPAHAAAPEAAGIAICVAQRVNTKQTELRAHTNVDVRDQLVLIKETCRLVR